MASEDVKLLPCPFCGGEAEIIEGEESAYVQCVNVKMHRALWFAGDNAAADEVREQWNRRAAQPVASDWDVRNAVLEEAAKVADGEVVREGEALSAGAGGDLSLRARMAAATFSAPARRPASHSSSLVERLLSWLRSRAEPDSGITYGTNRQGCTRVELSGSDATFVADNFHGAGARKLADAIAALAHPLLQPAPEAGVIEEAKFLIDRLDELEQVILADEDVYRNFAGHVSPSIARLKRLIAAPAPEPQADGVTDEMVNRALTIVLGREPRLLQEFGYDDLAFGDAPIRVSQLRDRLRTALTAAPAHALVPDGVTDEEIRNEIARREEAGHDARISLVMPAWAKPFSMEQLRAALTAANERSR